MINHIATRQAKKIKLNWNGSEFNILDKLYKTRINFIEKFAKTPDYIAINPKNYHEIVMDQAMVRFGKSPDSLGEPIQVFGVKIKISHDLPEDTAIAFNEPKIYGPKYNFRDDAADAFMYATMEATA